MPIEMAALVLEIDRVIGEVEDWKPEPVPTDEADPRAFVGHAAGWKIVVIDFDISPQGFPKGSRGWDGAASHRERGIVYHLLRQQARGAFDRAMAHCGKGEPAIKMCDVVDQGSPVKDADEEEQ